MEEHRILKWLLIFIISRLFDTIPYQVSYHTPSWAEIYCLVHPVLKLKAILLRQLSKC